MIYIEILNLKWEPGRVVMKGSPRKEVLAFESYIAKKYVELVRDRVETQKFKAKWAPLSPRYLGKKKEKGWSLKTWEATGQLMKELKVKSHNVVGFDNRKVHKVSGEKLLAIARKNEYGTSEVPARPLFRLVYWYMSKNIGYFYNRYRGGDKV